MGGHILTQSNNELFKLGLPDSGKSFFRFYVLLEETYVFLNTAWFFPIS